MHSPLATRRRSIGIVAMLCLIAAGTVTSCSDPLEPVTYADYLSRLQAICSSTTEQLLALPAAPEQIAVEDLATSASQLLDTEATEVSRLDVPSGDDVSVDDLDGDHRAFVRNTQEQADAWRAVATAGADELAEATQLIAQLVGGRNELADSMGAPSCVRGDL
ncbi:MAG TPA: hypothetical protein VES40_12615 [Ilumatobacteraceae bacterium]|nr:hypothetical protein [Ilumatobacteraceae bacterium]